MHVPCFFGLEYPLSESARKMSQMKGGESECVCTCTQEEGASIYGRNACRSNVSLSNNGIQIARWMLFFPSCQLRDRGRETLVCPVSPQLRWDVSPEPTLKMGQNSAWILQFNVPMLQTKYHPPLATKRILHSVKIPPSGPGQTAQAELHTQG